MEQTVTGRRPEEPIMHEPQDIAEVRMPVPEPDDDDPRTLVAMDEDFYEADDCA